MATANKLNKDNFLYESSLLKLLKLLKNMTNPDNKRTPVTNKDINEGDNSIYIFRLYYIFIFELKGL